MADNKLWIPELNPVIFFDTTRANLPKFYTKHFVDFPFRERGHRWQQRADYQQIWQTTDIIYLQFESSFDPINVYLLDKYGNRVIELPALIGLPNKFIPNTYAFEIAMALSGVQTGCYRLMVTGGAEGPLQKILISDCMYIYDGIFEDSILIEYWHSFFRKDVMFESGIKFQYRIFGHIDYDNLEKTRKDEPYRDQMNSPFLVSSQSSKQWPIYFGGDDGIPTDHFNLLDEIWGCHFVNVDSKSFAMAEGSKFEFAKVDKYRKFGTKLMIEPGINMNSRVFEVDNDPTKKLILHAMVDGKAFGDTANQGSNNAVPWINFQTRNN